VIQTPVKKQILVQQVCWGVSLFIDDNFSGHAEVAGPESTSFLDVSFWYKGSKLPQSQVFSNFLILMSLYCPYQWVPRVLWLGLICWSCCSTWYKPSSLIEPGFLSFFFFCGIGFWIQGLHLEPHSTSPFCVRYFQDTVLLALGWLEMAILCLLTI
jgi:hypothetical protein